jgi:hypothetical protein
MHLTHCDPPENGDLLAFALRRRPSSIQAFIASRSAPAFRHRAAACRAKGSSSSLSDVPSKIPATSASCARSAASARGARRTARAAPRYQESTRPAVHHLGCILRSHAGSLLLRMAVLKDQGDLHPSRELATASPPSTPSPAHSKATPGSRQPPLPPPPHKPRDAMNTPARRPAPESYRESTRTPDNR